ncbi:TIGR03750 family conjugal transfer protein [Acidovorax sp. NCPPB 3576]|uniref:TIGR03750 family conjugal transfer protein n=1 Tax=Acidovorax sp. NCPPB 3576 TaxID=2940488 RepID=UPI00234A4B34|nr:TIGR03750 family conjugal transfer protein [Acidovorax sp. NCPPB 3576]WCM90530.1 TIGR03750 family conjugal transfer protein [Acidovorax sp. NCPPB 3576]
MPRRSIGTADAPSATPHTLQSPARGAPVTDRVNVEPAILNGITVTEAKVIGLLALAVFLLLGSIVAAFTGLWQVLGMLALFGPMAVLWFSSTWLARIKRGRPDGYYTQYLHLWAARQGWVRCRFIGHEGWWDLGRSFEGSLASPLQPPREVPKDSPSRTGAGKGT